MIEFSCPSCDKSIRVDDKHAGKRGKCPKCGEVLVVPDRSSLIEFLCGGCGHWIRVAERYAGKEGKCPKCGKAVVVPEQETAEAAEASDTDETPYEEETSAGSSRRLVTILAGVVCVVVVCVVGLLVFFRPWDSGPQGESVIPQAPAGTSAPEPPSQTAQQTAVTESPPTQTETSTTEPPPQTVSADSPSGEQTTALEPSQSAQLRFAPNPGDKRTMRVTTITKYSMAIPQSGQAQEVAGTQSVTVELEAGPARADGNMTVKVTLQRIQVKTEMQGTVAGEYDSAQVPSEDDPVAPIYSPFVGKHFTVSVSGQGEIVDPGLEALFLTVAQDRAEAEDGKMRERLGGMADAAIERTDQRFGSRQGRILSLKKQLEEFPSFGREEILGLLDDLIVSLPAAAVQDGATWDAPIAISIRARLEMPATHTVTVLDKDACTIEAQGERTEDEKPFVYKTGPATMTNKLAGPSQLKLIIDRRTGWLQSKEQKTSLSGQVIQGPADGQGTAVTFDTNMEITTTVAVVE